MDEQRRYCVSGLDEDGDVHAFETNDLDRAEKMQKLMAEDLHHVELLTADPRASSTEPRRLAMCI
jgi:hypothetical protein